MDESDVFIYNDPSEFDNKLSKFKCICFTATCARKNDDIEQEILQLLEFKLFDYLPQ